MQSLELLLDDQTDARVRAAWTALSDAGLPSQADHRGASNRPHITLLVRETMDPDGVDASRLPLPITLGPPVILGRDPRWILAWTVVPSAELLALHARAHGALGAGDDAPHSAPGSWTPHVTLARRLSPADLGSALTLLDRAAVREGRATAMRHWDAIARKETLIT